MTHPLGPPPVSPLRLLPLVTALLAPSICLLSAPARGESLSTVATLGVETIRLPERERMGLVGSSLLFDLGADWWLGPAVYGAASGERGGFFVGGIELQRRWSLRPGLTLATGLYAGGGGGAAAPVGGGLMLRPALTLLKDIGPNVQLGVSWSGVRFPNGQISSSQLGVTMAWRSAFLHGSDIDHTASKPAGLGFDRMVATLASYRFDDGSGRSIGLVGARAEQRGRADGLAWGLEGAAAAQGDAAGYMELLATAAYSIEPAPSALPGWRVGVRAGVGAGGGGAVPTGGGLMTKLTGTMEWRVAPGWTLGGEYGDVRATNGPLRARQAQVWLGMSLEPALDGRGRADPAGVRTEWVGAWQHHTERARIDGSARSLDTIGLKLNRYLGENLYVSGQAHSAFSGGAGAYSIGLIGLGAAMQPVATWRVGVELLAGASGGGGVQSGGGALLQGMSWAGWNTAAHGEWRAGLGMVRSLRGGTHSPVIELGWSRAFEMPAR